MQKEKILRKDELMSEICRRLATKQERKAAPAVISALSDALFQYVLGHGKRVKIGKFGTVRLRHVPAKKRWDIHAKRVESYPPAFNVQFEASGTLKAALRDLARRMQEQESTSL